MIWYCCRIDNFCHRMSLDIELHISYFNKACVTNHLHHYYCYISVINESVEKSIMIICLCTSKFNLNALNNGHSISWVFNSKCTGTVNLVLRIKGHNKTPVAPIVIETSLDFFMSIIDWGNKIFTQFILFK